MKLTKNSIISTILFTFLIATLMALEEFYEGELSGEGAIEEILAYLSILAILLVSIVLPFSYMVNKMNVDMPWNENFLKRISIEGAVVIALSIGLGCTFGYFIHHYIDHNLPQDAVNIRTILFMLITSSLIMGLIELRYINNEKQELHQLAQRLEKEKVETLYNSLKNQVNPHFLFNSLSVLSSLIYLDTEKADEFIQHFSKIYRYALELNEQKLVTLEKELNFIESYLYLQKIRLGDNLTIDYQIHDAKKEAFIPPMSLQLVIENVLKHNAISKDQPMSIAIHTDDHSLMVKNKLTPRLQSGEASTGLGISNIKNRYQFLAQEMPTFEKTDHHYIVQLPLITNASKSA